MFGTLAKEIDKKIVELRDKRGRVVIQIGLLATLYFDNGYLPEKRMSVAECFDGYLERCGRHLYWTSNPDFGRWAELSRKSVPSPKEWLQTHALKENDTWFFEYHGGKTSVEASHYYIGAMGVRKWESKKGEIGFFRANFPLTWFDHHPDDFFSLVLNWCKIIEPIHGYGGIAIIESPELSTVQEHEDTVYAIAKRFPGLEVDHPIGHTLFLSKGIKGVNWLTVLDEKWLHKIGGYSELRKQIDIGFRLEQYPGGVIIQAGEQPDIGDVNRNHLPDHYVRLNRILKKIRVNYIRRFHNICGFDTEKTQSWISRFD
jgi:hypothetical protein